MQTRFFIKCIHSLNLDSLSHYFAFLSCPFCLSPFMWRRGQKRILIKRYSEKPAVQILQRKTTEQNLHRINIQSFFCLRLKIITGLLLPHFLTEEYIYKFIYIYVCVWGVCKSMVVGFHPTFEELQQYHEGVSAKVKRTLPTRICFMFSIEKAV